MVRGSEKEEKLRRSISNHDLDSNEILETARSRLLNYSMQDPLLGLDIREYSKLEQEVTIVMHSAWKMNFNQSIEYFEDDCIASKHPYSPDLKTILLM